MSLTLSVKIEAVLFWRGEPISVKKLASILEENEESVGEALKNLEENLQGRGLTLVYKEDEIMLGTAAEAGLIIEKLTKEELVRDLGKAGLETLSIILYKGPLSRREIDYIRGVNSNFILRNLLVRGLVEKIQSKSDQRTFLYKPTMELLAFMGLNRIEDLPEFNAVKEEIKAFEEAVASEKPEEKEETIK